MIFKRIRRPFRTARHYNHHLMTSDHDESVAEFARTHNYEPVSVEEQLVEAEATMDKDLIDDQD